MIMDEQSQPRESTVGYGIGIFLVIFVSGYAAGFIGARVIGHQFGRVLAAMVTFTVTLFFVWACGYSFNDLFRYGQKLNPNFWILTVVATIFLDVLTANISAYTNQLLPRTLLRAFARPDIVKTWTEYIFRIAVTGALGGFYQEFLFRGFLQTFFSKRLGGVKGFILTAFLFAIWHLDPLIFIRTFMFGLFLGYLVYLTGNLWLVILMHSLVNSFICSLKFFGPKIAPILYFFSFPSITLICAILFVAILDRLRKTHPFCVMSEPGPDTF